jgi:hypothetical protein
MSLEISKCPHCGLEWPDEKPNPCFRREETRSWKESAMARLEPDRMRNEFEAWYAQDQTPMPSNLVCYDHHIKRMAFQAWKAALTAK